MTRSEGLSRIVDSVWLPAILAGGLSMPVAFWLDSHLPVLMSLPVFIAGGCVGYYYRHQSKRAIRVGTRTGLVGGVPSMWEHATAFGLFTGGVGSGQSVVTTAIEIAPLLVVLLLAAGFAAVQGFMGTLVGVRTVRHRPSTEAT